MRLPIGERAGLRPHHRQRRSRRRSGPIRPCGRPTWAKSRHRAERARWLTRRCSSSPISRRATAEAGCCSVLRSPSRAGEMVSLMGRNGMGKTTTVRSIMGLTPAAAGIIRFNGVQIHGLPAYRIAKLGLGLVPEGRQVFPNLTARENLLATAPIAPACPIHGRSQKYSRSFRGSPNVQARWPICSPAASSRCWRSVAR